MISGAKADLNPADNIRLTGERRIFDPLDGNEETIKVNVDYVRKQHRAKSRR